ncbi:MAG: hypothetical protein R6U63_01265 [Longimicrobiales bacterium]
MIEGKGLRGWGVVVLLATAAGLLSAGPATAQDGRGLSFLTGLGYQQGGPGPDLVGAFIDAGLDDIERERCAGPVCQDSVVFPMHFSEGIGLAISIGFRYRFDAPFSVEVLAANGARGHAKGYRETNKDHLLVGYSSYVLGSTFGVHVGPVRLGAGPALLSTAWSAVQNSATRKKTTGTAVGGVAAVSYSVGLSDAVLSLRALLQGFRAETVPNPMQIPIHTQYQTFEIGVTVNPRGD